MSTQLQVEVLEGAHVLVSRPMGRYDSVLVGPAAEAEVVTDRVPRMIPMIRTSPGGKGWELVYPRSLDGHVTASGRTRTLGECASDATARADGDLAVFPLPEGAVGGIELGPLFLRFREVADAGPTLHAPSQDETNATATGIALVACMLAILALIAIPRGPGGSRGTTIAAASPTATAGGATGTGTLAPGETPTEVAATGTPDPATTGADATGTVVAVGTGVSGNETPTPVAGASATATPLAMASGVAQTPTPVAGASGTRATPTPVAAASGTRTTPTPVAAASGTRTTPTPVAAASGTRATPTPVAAASGTRATPTPVAAASGTRATPTPVAAASGTRATPTPRGTAVASASPRASATPASTGSGITSGTATPRPSPTERDPLALGVKDPRTVKTAATPARTPPPSGFLGTPDPLDDDTSFDARLDAVPAIKLANSGGSTGPLPSSIGSGGGSSAANLVRDGGHGEVGPVDVSAAGSGDVKVASAGKVETPVEARMETESPKVTGTIPADRVLAVVQEASPALRQCYEAVLRRNPRVSGRVVLAWTIVEDGAVEEVAIGSSKLENEEIERCLMTRVRRLRFPRPEGGTVKVEFPLVFQPAIDPT